MNSSETIIEIRDASVTFDMERGVSRVLNNVSVEIEREEIFGIVGESGSGKSMLAFSMLDAVEEPGVLTGDILYHPSDGRSINITELNKDELRKIRWEELSLVFQGAQSSFNPTRTIRKHFEETLRAHDKGKEKGMERARQLCRDVYLDPDRVLDSYPHELSGGMKQRALIALGMILDPEVVVMDEPTAALDLLMQRSIILLLREIQEKYDLTIVFITHDLPLVMGLADRIGVLYAFEFAEIGSIEEIMTNPSHPYTRALLKATPNVDAPLEEMRPIEGSSPDPVNVPTGCSYHPRCSLADEECIAEAPPYYRVTDRHDVRCHHWEQASEAIPLDFETDRSEVN